jgi:2-amino-4-hydroxy-6-hydroxymethyldihydropteridine diphosphokinase
MKILLSIGSNINDRLKNINKAVIEISKISNVKKISSVYETEPVDFEEQENFYNIAIELETDLEPLELFNKFKEIEKQIGRKQRLKWHEREIDIDIIFYDKLILNNESLQIPHPEYHKRRFVLIPMCEIAENFICPVRKKTVAEILKDCSDAHLVIKIKNGALFNEAEKY